MDDQTGTDRHDLLDRMLAAYGEVQAPAGLETRVLGTIEKTASRRRRRVWFVLGGPAAATAAALFLWWSRPTGPLERKPILIPKAATANSDAAVSTQAEAVKVPIQRQVSAMPVESSTAPVESSTLAVETVAANFATPRQSTFPAPSEPSAGEQAFLSLIHSDEQGLVALGKLFSPGVRSIDTFPASLEPVSLAAIYVNVEQTGESPQ